MKEKKHHQIRYVCYDTPNRKNCQAKVVIPHKLGNNPSKIDNYLKSLVRKWGGTMRYMTTDGTTKRPKVPKTVRMDRNDTYKVGKKPRPNKGRVYKKRTGQKVLVNSPKPGVIQAQEITKGKVKAVYTMGTPQFADYKKSKKLRKTSATKIQPKK